jgi:hypothetical protein
MIFYYLCEKDNCGVKSCVKLKRYSETSWSKCSSIHPEVGEQVRLFRVAECYADSQALGDEHKSRRPDIS